MALIKLTYLHVAILPLLLLAQDLALSASDITNRESKAEACHVILTPNQCVNLVGKWRAEHREASPNMLEIMATKNRSRFSFMVNIVRGDSLTHIENNFELKFDVGFYLEEPPISKEKPCSMVFLPITPKLLKLVSFGSCSEGFGANPDGIYTKETK